MATLPIKSYAHYKRASHQVGAAKPNTYIYISPGSRLEGFLGCVLCAWASKNDDSYEDRAFWDLLEAC